MTINPRDYDVDELRRGGGADPDGIVQTTQYGELAELEARMDDLHRPYLLELPETYQAEIRVFDWLEYLHEKAGFRGTLEAIRFYRSLGWLGADVEDRLEEYLRSFDGASDEPVALDTGDHRLSLVCIARLASMTAG